MVYYVLISFELWKFLWWVTGIYNFDVTQIKKTIMPHMNDVSLSDLVSLCLKFDSNILMLLL